MRVSYIELLGARHPLCFSLAAVDAIEDAFGSMEAMSEELGSGQIGRIARAADTVLSILLKAGRIYCSACGEELPLALPCRPADVIDVADNDTIKTIFQALKGDSRREVETETKNVPATPGE